MFEEWWFYLLVFGVSILLMFVYRLNLGPFRTILSILGFIGVIVHELSHYLLCVLLGVKVEKIIIRYRSRFTGRASPHGAVGPEEPDRISFLQALVIGLAPLFISSWLIILCFELLHMPGFDDLVYLGVAILLVSLFIGSAPSMADFSQCYYGFVRSPLYSLYQLFLIFLSTLTVFINFYSFQLVLPNEILNYIAPYGCIWFGYFVYKYLFRSLNEVYYKHYGYKRNTYKLTRLTRKRHRPVKARKVGIEEPHW
jgi:hypothetical protein